EVYASHRPSGENSASSAGVRSVRSGRSSAFSPRGKSQRLPSSQTTNDVPSGVHELANGGSLGSGPVRGNGSGAPRPSALRLNSFLTAVRPDVNTILELSGVHTGTLCCSSISRRAI